MPYSPNKAYFDAREAFSWDRPTNYNFVRDTFADWAASQPDATALHWRNQEGREEVLSYAAMLDKAGRAAAALSALGVQRGDTVILILSRELYWWELVLGCLQIGAIVSPGTIQLKAKDIAYRLTATKARAVISCADLARAIDEGARDANWSGVKLSIDAVSNPDWARYEDLRANLPPSTAYCDTAASDPALCYFTSGTTGNPKLTVHTHGYPLGHKATGQFWLRIGAGDLVWNLSDTGWAKAAWSSLFAPWLVGAGVFAFHTTGYDSRDTLNCLSQFPVTTLCAPPTVYRLLVRGDLSAARFKALKRCVSAGEPLNPEVIALWRGATGLEIYEGYGQTETVLLCGNFDGMEIRAGSMGLPAPGVDLQIIDEKSEILDPGVEGDIAVNVKPSHRPAGMFAGYQGETKPTVYRDDWYLTGDRAIRDEDGYFWFVGRSDDVIITSGYRIGPFEIESVLFEHDAVAESAVVASPDDDRGEVVKAFIVLSSGRKPSDLLVKELQDYVKAQTAPYKYPRKIEFVSELPKTISGKIKRKQLKAQEWSAQ